MLAFVFVAYIEPKVFSSFLGKPSNDFVQPLIQVAMLGMGVSLTSQDFLRVLKMPKAVGMGMLLQFTVMPLTVGRWPICFNYLPRLQPVWCLSELVQWSVFECDYLSCQRERRVICDHDCMFDAGVTSADPIPNEGFGRAI